MPTKLQATPKLKKVIRWLRKNFPTATPIQYRVVKEQPGLHGLCIIGEGRALIRITKDVDAVMLDVAIEEHCHVLRSECPVPIKDEHDAIFWAIYGTVSMAWRGGE
jgi:hypothetical protein